MAARRRVMVAARRPAWASAAMKAATACGDAGRGWMSRWAHQADAPTIDAQPDADAEEAVSGPVLIWGDGRRVDGSG